MCPDLDISGVDPESFTLIELIEWYITVQLNSEYTLNVSTRTHAKGNSPPRLIIDTALVYQGNREASQEQILALGYDYRSTFGSVSELVKELKRLVELCDTQKV